MAIRSIKQLPKGKRATAKQSEKAKKAKPIQAKAKVVGRRYGRTEVSLGKQKKSDVAGVVKGFRQKHKADFGGIIKDKNGNVIARTHVAKGNTTIPEQLIVRALAKYGKSMDEVIVVLIVVGTKTGKKRKKK